MTKDRNEWLEERVERLERQVDELMRHLPSADLLDRLRAKVEGLGQRFGQVDRKLVEITTRLEVLTEDRKGKVALWVALIQGAVAIAAAAIALLR